MTDPADAIPSVPTWPFEESDRALWSQAVTATESEMPMPHDDFVAFEDMMYAKDPDWVAVGTRTENRHGRWLLSRDHGSLKCDNCPWRDE